MPPPSLADTNVYVRAANEPSFRERFEAFIHLQGPLIVSSVVVAEILIGVPDLERHQDVIEALSRAIAEKHVHGGERREWVQHFAGSPCSLRNPPSSGPGTS